MEKNNSRRSFFKYMTVLGLTTVYASALHAKTTKSIVDYQPTPKDGNRCKTCMHFIPETNECATVEGSIDPDGWCMLYYKKPDNAKG